MTHDTAARSHAFRLGLWLGLLIGAIAALLGRAGAAESAPASGAAPTEVSDATPTVKVAPHGGSPL